MSWSPITPDASTSIYQEFIMCLELLLFFQHETPLLWNNNNDNNNSSHLQTACPHDSKQTTCAIPISQRRKLRLQAGDHVSKTTQMVLSHGLELRLKTWTLEPANRLNPASQGEMELFGRSDLVPAKGCAGFSHTCLLFIQWS